VSLADWAEDGGPSRGPGLDFASWCDQLDGVRVGAALARLDATPPAPGRTQHFLHPFGFVDRGFIKQQFPNEVIHAAIECAPVVPVRLDHIVSLQHTVTKSTVRAYVMQGGCSPPGVRDPDHGGFIDHPIIIRCSEVNCLWDGNNRLTAAHLLGATEWPCRFVDLDDGEFLARVHAYMAASAGS